MIKSTYHLCIGVALTGIAIDCQFFWLDGFELDSNIFNSSPISIKDLIQFLIEKGFDVNVKNGMDWTPLLLLCRNYSPDNLIHLVKLLVVENGADVAIKTPDR